VLPSTLILVLILFHLGATLFQVALLFAVALRVARLINEGAFDPDRGRAGDERTGAPGRRHPPAD
jgi:hypothetical protein